MYPRFNCFFLLLLVDLTLQASLLAYMFKMVENGVITVSLSSANPPTPLSADPSQAASQLIPATAEQNVQFVHQRLLELLKQAFPHLQEAQLVVFIKGLFALNTDLTAFREHLRDFLVQIREISGEDLSDLYLEEREAELAAAQAEKLKQKAGVPGLLGPNNNESSSLTAVTNNGNNNSAAATSGGMDMAD